MLKMLRTTDMMTQVIMPAMMLTMNPKNLAATSTMYRSSRMPLKKNKTSMITVLMSIRLEDFEAA